MERRGRIHPTRPVIPASPLFHSPPHMSFPPLPYVIPAQAGIYTYIASFLFFCHCEEHSDAAISTNYE
jgi:hypothetical protein